VKMRVWEEFETWLTQASLSADALVHGILNAILLPSRHVIHIVCVLGTLNAITFPWRKVFDLFSRPIRSWLFLFLDTSVNRCGIYFHEIKKVKFKDNLI